jgi:hypothetical protein
MAEELKTIGTLRDFEGQLGQKRSQKTLSIYVLRNKYNLWCIAAANSPIYQDCRSSKKMKGNILYSLISGSCESSNEFKN